MGARAAAACGGMQRAPARPAGTLGAWRLCFAHGARGARRARAKRRALPAETNGGTAGAGRRRRARGARGRAIGKGEPRVDPCRGPGARCRPRHLVSVRGGRVWSSARGCAGLLRRFAHARSAVRGARVRVRGQASCRSLRRRAAGSPGHAVAETGSRAAASAVCFAARTGWQCVVWRRVGPNK